MSKHTKRITDDQFTKPQIPTTADIKSDTQPQHMVVLSYWPLLDNKRYNQEPGGTIPVSVLKTPDGAGQTNLDIIIKDMQNNLPDGRATGCVWLMDKDAAGVHRPYPALIMPKAKEIADHFRTWADNEPEEWFKLWVAWDGTDDSRYAVMLTPNVQKSIERWRLARFLIQQQVPPTPTECTHTVLFQPLLFGSCSPGCFSKIRSLLPTRMRVALLDEDIFDPAAPLGPQLEALTDADFHQLGTFELPSERQGPVQSVDKEMMSYISEFLIGLEDQALDKSQPPKFRGWVNPDVNI